MFPLHQLKSRISRQKLAFFVSLFLVSFFIFNVVVLGNNAEQETGRLNNNEDRQQGVFFVGLDDPSVGKSPQHLYSAGASRFGLGEVVEVKGFNGARPAKDDGASPFADNSFINSQNLVNSIDDNGKDPLRTVKSIVPKYRVVHIDLKGAPLKVSFYQTLFSLIHASGGNAILLEYEDMFPYWGPLANASAKNAYSREDIYTILKTAQDNNLEVIPLVQTFGHLEFILKLEEFKHLRELSAFPQEICPSKVEAFELVKELITQVMSFHTTSKWIHIGCDEVYHLAACSKCYDRLKDMNNNRMPGQDAMEGKNIFLDHVRKVATFVKSQFGLKSIVWDDMFRHMFRQDIADSGVGQLVEPMVWIYIEDIPRLVPHYVWQMYSEVFPSIWGASAFKGAFGETLYIPNIKRHLDNNLAWLEFITRQQRYIKFNFQGLVLTGWSRYDHFAVLCELLPSSIPSLLINLIVSKAGGGKMDDNFLTWHELLSCPKLKPVVTSSSLMSDPYQWELQECAFPGNNFFSSLHRYAALKYDVDAMYVEVTEKQGWMTEYNVKHKYSSPWRVTEMIRKQPFLFSAVRDFRNSTERILSQYYDKYVAQEWLEQKVDPLLGKLNYIQTAAEELMSREVWPRRPVE